MTPLLFAAAITLSPAVAGPSKTIHLGPDVTAACEALGLQTVAPDGVPFRRLNELPPGIVEHAVWRTVEGCPVREIVYNGRRVYVGPSIPKLDTGPDVAGRIARKTYRTEPVPSPNAH